MDSEVKDREFHPSRHLLTRFHTDDLEERERSAIQRHIGECSLCSEMVRKLDEAKESFRKHHDRDGFIASVRYNCEETDRGKKHLWLNRKIRPIALGFSTALVILGLAIVVMKDGGRNEQTERTKGSKIELSYFVMQEHGPEIASKDQVLHPHDRIQFRITAPAGGYVHIVSVDEKGAISVYFPLPGQRPEAFPGGSGRPVPGSVILDEVTGRERVFLLLCNQSMSRKQLENQVNNLSESPQALLDKESLPISCSQSSILLHKSVGGR